MERGLTACGSAASDCEQSEQRESLQDETDSSIDSASSVPIRFGVIAAPCESRNPWRILRRSPWTWPKRSSRYPSRRVAGRVEEEDVCRAPSGTFSPRGFCRSTLAIRAVPRRRFRRWAKGASHARSRNGLAVPADRSPARRRSRRSVSASGCYRVARRFPNRSMAGTGLNHGSSPDCQTASMPAPRTASARKIGLPGEVLGVGVGIAATSTRPRTASTAPRWIRLHRISGLKNSVTRRWLLAREKVQLGRSDDFNTPSVAETRVGHSIPIRSSRRSRWPPGPSR